EIETHWIGSRLQSLLNRFRPAAGGGPPPRPPQPVRAILTDPMRGTYLGGAVASALRDSADLWAQPAAPPDVADVETNRLGATVSAASPLTGRVSTPAGPSTPGTTLP